MKKETKHIKQLKELAKLGKKPKDMRLAAESWKNDFQTLFSTILSARTHDEVTIPISKRLFKKYPTPEKLAKADIKDIRKIIKPINFYKNKSKNIINCAEKIVSRYKGKIPYDFEKLLSLPGVGRKTANVFLNEVGYDAIGIDTHVTYISKKIGWTENTKPEKIEHDLKILFPKKYWSRINSTLVRFGKTHTSKKKKDLILEKIKKIK